MPTLIFQPRNLNVDVEKGSKILAAARRNKVDIRFGCGACQCGTCAVKVTGDGTLSKMAKNENELLTKMKLPTDGSIRLSCQARIEAGSKTIDIGFQSLYSPDVGLGT